MAAEQWLRAISFRELVIGARRLLNPSPQVLDPQRVRQEQEIIALPMIRCFATTHVDLSFTPCTFTKMPSEKPTTLKLARYQAQSANRVTNLCHQTVNISDLQRHLLQRLDGNHDRSQLVDFLAGQVEQGKLIAHEAGDEVRDPIRVREMLTEILESNLTQLTRKCLLLETGVSYVPANERWFSGCGTLYLVHVQDRCDSNT